MKAQPAGRPLARPLSPRPILSTFTITTAWNLAPVKNPIFGSIILKFKRRLTKLSVLNKPRRPPRVLSMMHSLPFRSPTRERISFLQKENAPTIRGLTERSWPDGMDGYSDGISTWMDLIRSRWELRKVAGGNVPMNYLSLFASVILLPPAHAVGGICTTTSNRSWASLSFMSRPTL